MASKREFFLRSENAHPHAISLFYSWDRRWTKVVSDKLNSRAMACIRSVSYPMESITTASGLPASAMPVKTSTTKYSNSGTLDTPPIKL